MILAGRPWKDVVTIRHHDETGLFAFEKCLHHHAVARSAKRVSGQHVMYSRFGLGNGPDIRHAGYRKEEEVGTSRRLRSSGFGKAASPHF